MKALALGLFLVATPAVAQDLAITDVTVVDTRTGALASHQTDELALFRAMLPRLQKTVERMQKAGVTLLAGADVAADRAPGFSLHAELDLLAEAGLTSLEVLQTATINPARVMKRTADYGSVQAGKLVDLVLLDSDPTRNTAALHRIFAVVLHGKLLDRSALDAHLKDAETLAEGS